MDKNRFVNSVNLNIGTRFPYFVVDAIDDKPFPPNPGFRLMHWHEDLQFILVTDGRITVQTLDEKVEVGAGEAIFINARVIHRITKIGTCRYRSFIFPASFLSFFPGSPAEDLVTRVTENQDIRLIRFSDDTDWNREVLARLTRLYKLEDQAKDETYAYEVLIELARRWLVLVRNLSTSRFIFLNRSRSKTWRGALASVSQNAAAFSDRLWRKHRISIFSSTGSSGGQSCSRKPISRSARSRNLWVLLR